MSVTDFKEVGAAAFGSRSDVAAERRGVYVTVRITARRCCPVHHRDVRDDRRGLQYSEGMPIKAIARVVGVCRNTVRRALACEGPPEYRRSVPRS
ncbi:helix-turn-helix domain-containing protein [Mycolicibacterium aubagnense]|uniref:helix-turn-helix domain-containing protein n=1 Tax=Mycolicibacterium aubagnense TaxID=319707 RepID=UPI0010FDB84A